MDEAENDLNTLYLEYSSGLKDSRDFSLSADIALPTGDRLIVGARKSDLSSNTGQYPAYGFSAAFHSEYGRPFEWGIAYDFWGNTDDLWTNAISLPLRLNTNNWSFSLRPEYTQINIYRRILFNNSRVLIETSSTALDTSLSYYGWHNWDITARVAGYQYEDNIEGLSRPVAQLYFSDIALVLSYGFPKYRASLQAGYQFTHLYFALKQERTVSAVDQARLDITSAKTAYNFSDALTLHLEGGHIQIDDGSTTQYLKLAGLWRY